MRDGYYNTTSLSGGALSAAREHAGSQDERLLAFFRAHPEQSFTRDEVHELVLPEAQNTSVTRSLNTLMKDGRLAKLEQFRPGRMKAKQHLWQYVGPQQRKLI